MLPPGKKSNLNKTLRGLKPQEKASKLRRKLITTRRREEALKDSENRLVEEIRHHEITDSERESLIRDERLMAQKNEDAYSEKLQPEEYPSPREKLVQEKMQTPEPDPMREKLVKTRREDEVKTREGEIINRSKRIQSGEIIE